MNKHVANETRTEIADASSVLTEVTALRERLAVLEESLQRGPSIQ